MTRLFLKLGFATSTFRAIIYFFKIAGMRGCELRLMFLASRLRVDSDSDYHFGRLRTIQFFQSWKSLIESFPKSRGTTPFGNFPLPRRGWKKAKTVGYHSLKNNFNPPKFGVVNSELFSKWDFESTFVNLHSISVPEFDLIILDISQLIVMFSVVLLLGPFWGTRVLLESVKFGN